MENLEVLKFNPTQALGPFLVHFNPNNGQRIAVAINDITTLRCVRDGEMEIYIRGGHRISPDYIIPLQWIEMDGDIVPFVTIISTQQELFDFMFKHSVTSEEVPEGMGEPLGEEPITMPHGFAIEDDIRMPGEPLD